MPETDVLIGRAELLLSQGRPAEAIKQLTEVLRQEPQNTHALGLMARARFDQKNFEAGIELANRAVSIEPNESYFHYLLAFGYYLQDKNADSQSAIYRAIQLNPYQAEYFGLWSLLLLEKNQFEQALARANEGLALDAESISCLNARATALNKLKRTDDAIDTMRTALDQDPENYFTHTTVGWNLLEKGKQKEATKHFREALRLNPNAEAARAGLKQSLKSNIPPYKWLLQYSFWINNKGKQARWIIPIGIYIGVRVVGALSKNAPPAVAMIGTVLVGLYILIALASWFLNPLANIFLFFHKDGKHALSTNEKWNAVLTTSALVTGITLLATGFFNGQQFEDSILMLSGLVLVAMAMPLSLLEVPLRLRHAPKMQYYIMALVALGLICLGFILTGNVNDILFALFLFGVVAFTWIIPFSR